MTTSRKSDNSLTRRRLLQYGTAAAAGTVASHAGGVMSALATPAAPDTAGAERALGMCPGDRHPGNHAVYPDDVFRHNNPAGRVIDVTKVEESLAAPPGTNARPDGTGDSSDAFRFYFDFIRDLLAQHPDHAGFFYPQDSYILYVPNGVYQVLKHISYTGPDLDGSNWGMVRIVGESREGTIIRLPDAAEWVANRAVIDITREARTLLNHVSQNAVRNLTIDTGSGNPRVIGLRFTGANIAEVSNVTIRSGDGQGQSGMVVPINAAHGYYRDITIDGFGFGIKAQRPRGVTGMINPAVEYVTLRNQNTAAVYIDGCRPSIRALHSDNSVPAVVINHDGAHPVLVDSLLEGGAPNVPAIDLQDDGFLFVRNVFATGYQMALRRRGEPEIPGRYIPEYVSHPIIRFDEEQVPQSMDLPVEESPPTPWPDVSQWANVDEFGAVGDGMVDDSVAIQAAFNSGAQAVYFPKSIYRTDETVDVPATVRQVELLFTTFTGAPQDEAAFRVGEYSSDPIVFDDFQYLTPDENAGMVLVQHDQPRTVVMNFIYCGGSPRNVAVYRPDPDREYNGDVFLNSVNSFGKADGSEVRNQRVWARWVNTESKASFFVGSGATMWVLGFKTERTHVKWDVADGGTLELLGGNTSATNGSDLPLFRNTNSNISIITSGNGRPSETPVEVAIEDIQDGITKIVLLEDLPVRAGPGVRWAVPLYVSYDPSVVRPSE